MSSMSLYKFQRNLNESYKNLDELSGNLHEAGSLNTVWMNELILMEFDWVLTVWMTNPNSGIASLVFERVWSWPRRGGVSVGLKLGKPLSNEVVRGPDLLAPWLRHCILKYKFIIHFGFRITELQVLCTWNWLKACRSQSYQSGGERGVYLLVLGTSTAVKEDQEVKQRKRAIRRNKLGHFDLKHYKHGRKVSNEEMFHETSDDEDDRKDRRVMCIIVSTFVYMPLRPNSGIVAYKYNFRTVCKVFGKLIILPTWSVWSFEDLSISLHRQSRDSTCRKEDVRETEEGKINFQPERFSPPRLRRLLNWKPTINFRAVRMPREEGRTDSEREDTNRVSLIGGWEPGLWNVRIWIIRFTCYSAGHFV